MFQLPPPLSFAGCKAFVGQFKEGSLSDGVEFDSHLIPLDRYSLMDVIETRKIT